MQVVPVLDYQWDAGQCRASGDCVAVSDALLGFDCDGDFVSSPFVERTGARGYYRTLARVQKPGNDVHLEQRDPDWLCCRAFRN